MVMFACWLFNKWKKLPGKDMQDVNKRHRNLTFHHKISTWIETINQVNPTFQATSDHNFCKKLVSRALCLHVSCWTSEKNVNKGDVNKSKRHPQISIQSWNQYVNGNEKCNKSNPLFKQNSQQKICKKKSKNPSVALISLNLFSPDVSWPVGGGGKKSVDSE